jgi:two-component system, NarL family, response regulator DesR
MKPAARQTLSVLVADDSAILRERLAGLLEEREGLRGVGLAGPAAEAWRLFLQRRPDAVVLDVKLPDGSGIDLLRQIKGASPHCVVLMLTNYDEAEFEEECHRQGADFFLRKATEFETAADLLSRLPLPPSQARPTHAFSVPAEPPPPASRPIRPSPPIAATLSVGQTA